MKKVSILFFCLSCVGLVLWAHWMKLDQGRSPASMTGYISDVRSEKSESYYEVYLVPPRGEERADYRGKIFNSQLTREFRQKYIESFGYIDNDGLTYSANKFTQYDDRGRTQAFEETNQKRRTYAEYMVRRLGEWHVDNYFKSDPSMRKVYELKEQLSNVKVEVGKQTKIDLHYSFSDNSAEIVLDNPYCDAKLRIEMDPKAFGPAGVQEQRLYVGQKVTSSTYVRGQLTDKSKLSGIEWWTSYRNNISTSVTALTPYQKREGDSQESSIRAAILHSF